jgi:hypothetical protein
MAVKDSPEVDYRTERMPSAEGHGQARDSLQRAWAAYERGVRKTAEPLLRPVAKKVAAPLALDLLGFWLAWHLEGGFEGLQRIGLSRASIYRRISLFRKTMGQHPDDFRFPGVDIDLEAYLNGDGKPIADRATHPARKSQNADK